MHPQSCRGRWQFGGVATPGIPNGLNDERTGPSVLSRGQGAGFGTAEKQNSAPVRRHRGAQKYRYLNSILV